MKTILCFGDSNTFGFNPINGSRYDKSTRWTGLLSQSLTNKFKIIEAGCNNRTGFFNNPAGQEQSGLKVFPFYLEKYNPDIVILAIGINDLQFQYDATIEDIKNGLEKYFKLLENKEIILLIPTIISNNILNSFFAQMFDITSINKSKLIPPIYEEIAKKYNAKFIDLNKIVKPSEIDGLHYNIEMHKIIAQAIIKVL